MCVCIGLCRCGGTEPEMMVPGGGRSSPVSNNGQNGEPAPHAYATTGYDDGSLGGDSAFLQILNVICMWPVGLVADAVTRSVDFVARGARRARVITRGVCRFFPC